MSRVCICEARGREDALRRMPVLGRRVIEDRQNAIKPALFLAWDAATISLRLGAAGETTMRARREGQNCSAD